MYRALGSGTTDLPAKKSRRDISTMQSFSCVRRTYRFDQRVTKGLNTIFLLHVSALVRTAECHREVNVRPFGDALIPGLRC